MVISALNQEGSTQQYLLLLGVIVWLIGSTPESALATGSTQPRSDWDLPSPLSFDRSNQQNSMPQFTHDWEANRERMNHVAKPADLMSIQPSGSAENEEPSADGPVVVGRVIHRGTVPLPIQVEVPRDVEVCGQVVTVPTMLIDPATHGVRDAIVHAGQGMETRTTHPPHVSTVQNKGCVFYPRIAALQIGTQAEITNEDPVMHNTNITLESRTVLNVALVAGGNPIRKPLKKEGVHLVTCNVHKFMQAYRYVFNHPFFAQTNDTGQFRITGLSPGSHTISVWHETLGVLYKEVQVPARGIVTTDFEFK